MAAELLTDLSRATDANSSPLPGAEWYFYATGTTTPQSVYTTAALSVEHANPVVADSGGQFAPIYFNAGLQYRGVLKTAGGVTLKDIDPINMGLFAQFSGPTGSNLIGVQQSGAGAVTRTVEDELRDWVKPQQFNSAGDGVDDDTIPLQQTITRAGVNGTVHILPGNYRITSTLDMLEGQTWICEGARISTSDAGLTMIRANGVDNWTINGSLRLIGPRVAETTGSGVGLLIADCGRFKVSGVLAEKIVGAGFKLTSSTIPTYRGDQGQFTDCAAFDCVTGRNAVAGSSAEYSTWTNFNACGNYVGIDDSAGNTTQVGGSISDNIDTGIKLTAGANSAHGMFTGVNINHNGVYNLFCSGVYNGHTFTGCHFYDGDIVFKDSDGVILDGGDFDPGNVYNQGAIYTGSIAGTTLTVTAASGAPIAVGQVVMGAGIANNTEISALGTGTGGTGTYTVSVSQTVSSRQLRSSGWNFIRNMNCPASAVTVHSAGQNDSTRVVVTDCFGKGAVTPGGVSLNDPSPVYVHARRVGGGGTQAVSTATTLIFNNVQVNGNRRLALDEATGVMTAPKGGQYRLRAHLSFTVTDSTVAGSYVDFRVNGGSGVEAFIGSLYSTTLLTFAVDRELYLNAGDTIALTATVNGTSPVFGSASFDSGVSLELIA